MATSLWLPFPTPDSGTPSHYVNRPYVKAHVVNRVEDVRYPLLGLVDSGADRTCLPFSMASALGYDEAELEETTIEQVQGSLTGFAASQPCRAFVKGLDEIDIELMPLFIEGCEILWGRTDFFAAFQRVCFLVDGVELIPH